MELIQGRLQKMQATLQADKSSIQYRLMIPNQTELSSIEMNDYIGRTLAITYVGFITCQTCGEMTRKSFAQGFCYPCMRSAPEAAECILRPALCRAHMGEGRDPEWEERHHNQPHIVYFALSSAVKVGVTRHDQVPTRWIDQGASQALIVARTPNRYLAGRIETELSQYYTDRTSWQRMLKGELLKEVDLRIEKAGVEGLLSEELRSYISKDQEVTCLDYPVQAHPTKVKSYNLDRDSVIQGRLVGIKGQYLIFEGGRVINLRRFTGYHVRIAELIDG